MATIFMMLNKRKFLVKKKKKEKLFGRADIRKKFCGEKSVCKANLILINIYDHLPFFLGPILRYVCI